MTAPAFCPTIETSFPPESPMAPLADALLPRTTTTVLVPRASWTPFIEHRGAALVAAPVSEHPALFITYTVSESTAQCPSVWLMQTPGFGGKLVLPEHWVSAVQAPHLFMVVSQMGVVPEQLPSPVHCTHTLPFEQTGVPPTHWVALVAEHCAQAPPARQAGALALFALHAASPVHAMHLFAVLSQIGVAPEHCESSVHCTHTLPVEQTGVPPAHWLPLVAEHCAHVPPVRQAGAIELFALQAASPEHAVHLFVVLSQIGVAPEHCESSVHCTHRLPLEQTGVAPVHWLPFEAEHCAHPPPARHAGAVALFALQVASPAHAAHLFAVLSQIGVVPEHCESLVHCTQTFVGEHTGRPASPTQSLSTPHSAQAPFVRQAGVAGFLAAHWPTVAQAEQTCVVVLQTGAAGDLQSVL